jgi:hypothetical protein
MSRRWLPLLLRLRGRRSRSLDGRRSLPVAARFAPLSMCWSPALLPFTPLLTDGSAGDLLTAQARTNAAQVHG